MKEAAVEGAPLVERRESHELAAELAEADSCWRLLEVVTARLAKHRDVARALPGISEHLAAFTRRNVVFVLTNGGSVDQVVGWPPEHFRIGDAAPVHEALGGNRSVWSKAVLTSLEEGRETHLGEGWSASSEKDPRLPPGVGSAVVIPLSAQDTSRGALIAYSPELSPIRPRPMSVLREVARWTALALEHSELAQNVAQLKDANEAARLREELLAALSHDMQTPLAVLLGSIKALQAVDDLAPKHRAGLYESMGRRGNQLHRLVQQFLDYSRLEAGRPIEARPSPTDVGSAIARMEADVGWRRPLEINVSDELPRALVDPDRLDHVLANLLSNALKFSPVGSLLSITARAVSDKVEIEVADRGRGMSEAELERAFGKFYRGEGAKGTAGTGLGLYVSRAVIEAQGGRLLAESAPGEGSRFTVVLPCAPMPTAESRTADP